MPRQSGSKKTPVIDTSIGHVPPQDVEIEKALLGALLIDRDAFTVVSELISPETFWDPRHQKIYNAIQTLNIKELPVDYLTVMDELKREGTYEEVGAPAYIIGLTENVMSSAHIEHHASILRDKYMARELISFSSRVATNAFDEGQDIKDVMQGAEADLFAKQQEAEGIRKVGEAEAAAIAAKGLAEAEALEKKAEAMKKYGQAAMMEMIVKALPEMAAEIAKPLSTIDKVTIIDSGNGGDTGVGSMGSYVPSVLAQTIESVKETTGIDIREIMKANTYDAKVNKNITVSGLDGLQTLNVSTGDAIETVSGAPATTAPAAPVAPEATAAPQAPTAPTTEA